MKLRDLISKLENLDQDANVFIGHISELIGGDYADCRERIELKIIKGNIILSPKGTSVNVYDFETK